MASKYHLQRNSKLGNASGNTLCNTKGSLAGWNTIALPAAEWKELRPSAQCSKCAAKLAAQNTAK